MNILKELHPEWKKNCANNLHRYDISGRICEFCNARLQDKIEGSQKYGKIFIEKIELPRPKQVEENFVFYDWHQEYLDEKKAEEFEARLESIAIFTGQE